jgi:hypothetical protein
MSANINFEITGAQVEMFKNMVLFIMLFSVVLLSACSGAAPQLAAATAVPAVVTASPTIDPCMPQYAHVLAQRVHSHMREFDDASTLAASLGVDKLPSAIAELQRIRRSAQDEPVPSCLGQLKELQVGHMNMVIDTMLGMLNGAKPEALQTGILNARKLHDDYTLELANVLGVTIVAKPTNISGTAGTEAPAVTVINPGPNPVNLRAAPDLNAAVVTVFAVNSATPVLGKSADGKWVQVDVPEKPGEKAWLYLEAVTLSGALDAVPVVTQ